jgi:RNA polymerase sigma factor (sigma-70 family)
MQKKKPERPELVVEYMSFKARLRRLVARIVKPHDIDDILQETFVRAYAAAQKTEIRHPRSFMLKTARNLALNHVSSAYNKRVQIEDFSTSDVYLSTGSVESDVDSNERFLAFCRAVRDLPQQCRRVFILSKVYGLSQREIAEYLEISESTVEKHIAKGLLLCRRSMCEMGYFGSSPMDEATVRREKGK